MCATRGLPLEGAAREAQRTKRAAMRDAPDRQEMRCHYTLNVMCLIPLD